MKRRTIALGVVAIVGVVVVASGGRWFLRSLEVDKIYRVPAYLFGELVASYIVEKGQFPPSEADLHHDGFLKKEDISGRVVYFQRAYGSRGRFGWSRLWSADVFESFRIAYGARPENLELVDGTLYDKATNQQLLLIDGPHHQKLKEDYAAISKRWYEVMLERAKLAPDANNVPDDGKAPP